MKVLSLFDGISCGRVALERAGFKVDKYYASEVDKYAIKVSENNHSDIIRLGDINNWRDWNIEWSDIDLVLAGSPCQGFSFAGKQLAFNDPRSKLFFVFIDILDHINGEKMLHYAPPVKFLLENVKMKKEYLDVISAHVGVEPVFINSSLVSAQNRQRYYWANWDFGLPDDKGIVLSDILDNGAGVIKSYGEWKDKNNKSQCLDANYFKGVDNHGQRTMVAFLEPKVIIRNKSKCIRAGGLRSYDRHEWDSISDCHYRKLTPIECERLQTLPDNYTVSVSNTQRYKCLGNAWTVDVIAHILRAMRTNP